MLARCVLLGTLSLLATTHAEECGDVSGIAKDPDRLNEESDITPKERFKSYCGVRDVGTSIDVVEEYGSDFNIRGSKDFRHIRYSLIR